MSLLRTLPAAAWVKGQHLSDGYIFLFGWASGPLQHPVHFLNRMRVPYLPRRYQKENQENDDLYLLGINEHPKKTEVGGGQSLEGGEKSPRYLEKRYEDEETGDLRDNYGCP